MPPFAVKTPVVEFIEAYAPPTIMLHVVMESTDEIKDTVISTNDRVNSLPVSVTNDRIIELLQQDGASAPGVYKGVGGTWVAQADSVTEKLASADAAVVAVSALQFYDIAGNISGKPDASASVLKIVTPRIFNIPSGFDGSQVVCSTIATDTTTFTIKRWNVQHSAATVLGTIVFNNSSNVGSFSQTGSGVMAFAVGETLEIVAPSSQDATLADIAYVISATLP